MSDRPSQIGRWGAIVCFGVFILAMLVPGPPMPERRDSFPGWATLVVGYFFSGIIHWPAHILFLVGVGKCLAGSIRGLVLVSVLAVVLGVCTGGLAVVEQFHKSTLLKYPAIPLWMVSLCMLVVTAVVLDLSSTARRR